MRDIAVKRRNSLSIGYHPLLLDDLQLAQAPAASHLVNRGEVVKSVGGAKPMQDVAETPRQTGAGADCGLGPQVPSGGGI